MKKLFFLALSATVGLMVGGGNGQSAVAEPQGRIVWELLKDKANLGPVQRGVVDPEGKVVHLATLSTLYEIQDGKVQRIIEQPEKEARLALAPGGGIYSWLCPHPQRRGHFYVKLFDLPGKGMAELKLKEFPYGFGTLYLGLKGKLIVTASALDDPDGIRGRFQINFWNQQGEMLEKVILEGRQAGVKDLSGEAILFLGEKEATAFSASGKKLWPRPLTGRFRKAAIARGGKLALLNPGLSKNIHQVLVYKGEGEPMIVNVPTPVHNLTLAGDGSLAVVVGDQGRYFFLDPKNGGLKEGRRLPLEGTFYIRNLKPVDDHTVVMGVIHREGEPPKVTWPKGTIIVIDREGRVAFQKEFPIRVATAFIPQVDVTFGSRFVIGYTEDATVLIGLR